MKNKITAICNFTQYPTIGYTVYQINIGSKVYIGMTKNLKARIRQHTLNLNDIIHYGNSVHNYCNLTKKEIIKHGIFISIIESNLTYKQASASEIQNIRSTFKTGNCINKLIYTEKVTLTKKNSFSFVYIRHIKANEKLQEIASFLLGNGDDNKILSTIAVKLNVTYQTIRNYCYGMGSDGYLKDAIIEELKKIK
jgi:hypothetical protein